MPHTMLFIADRKKIFADLIRIQDARTMSVGESVKVIAARYGISEEYLQKIAREGMENDWPPFVPEDQLQPRTPFPPAKVTRWKS